MIAVASALFLLVPVGVMADPISDVFRVGGRVVAEVRDVELLEPNFKPHAVGHHLRPEQVVEGHTTFVTLTAFTHAEVDTGNVTIDGFVHCENHGNFTTSVYYVGPVPVPIITRVDNVNAECHFGEQVIVTPTVYCTVTGDFDCGTSTFTMSSTGRLLPFSAPGDQGAYAEELMFTDYTGDDSTQAFTTYYAYATPILEEWTRDGKTKNFQLSIPMDRIHEMGDTHFSVLFADQVKRG